MGILGFSKYPPDVSRMIKEMKRSGMAQPLAVVRVPVMVTGAPNVDELGKTTGEIFQSVASMTASSPANRFPYAESVEKYVTVLSAYADALANFAKSIDPALTGAAEVGTTPALAAAIARARLNPSTATAAEAAQLASVVATASIAVALTCYALRAHTAEDRVWAARSTEAAVAAIGRYRSAFNH